MRLEYGYVSNGFRDHTLDGMIEILAGEGYDAIGITLDHAHLDPFLTPTSELTLVRERLFEAGLKPVIETGARYILDPRRKHWPNLVSETSPERAIRVDYYCRAIETAADLGASVVSLWSGTAPEGTSREEAWDRLVSGLMEVLDHAARYNVVIGFEPEPGMLVESLADFDELRARISHGALRLTLDLGHLAVTEDEPRCALIPPLADVLVNVHVEDIRGRVHEHLPLGEGDLDFAPLLGALRRVNYSGAVLVELSRNSHDAPYQASRSLPFLRREEERGTH